MDGAEKSLASSEAVARMTNQERVHARRECRSWTTWAEIYCDFEWYADGQCGQRRMSPDRIVASIYPQSGFAAPLAARRKLRRS